MSPIEQACNYRFREESLLKGALRHSSVGGGNFERLEFLGDRVIGLVMAKWLYEKWPNDPEGFLAKRQAKMVAQEALCKIAISIRLDQNLRFQRLEKGKESSIPTSVLADACETLIGAIFLDGGWDAVEQVVRHLWTPLVQGQETEVVPLTDAKSLLQELLQGKKRGLPTYEVREMMGPSHQPTFLVAVVLDDGTFFLAEGASKRKAEQRAAEIALDSLS